MVKLKNKIKLIDSLPNKKKTSTINILIITMIIIFIILMILFAYLQYLPYLKATDIKKITGKKTYITTCNTKDYIIIEKDKTYNMLLTNENCKQEYQEGTLNIKNNNIIFNKNIIGIIDNEYNIIINDRLFESDKNE